MSSLLLAVALLTGTTGAAVAGGHATTAHVETTAPTTPVPTARGETPTTTDAARYAAREAKDQTAAPFRGGGTSTLVISGGTVTVVLLIVLLVILL